MRWVTRDDKVCTHCSGAPLVVALALFFHHVRNRSHRESLYFHEDWPENTHAEGQHLESGKRQQPGEMGQAEQDGIDKDERHVLSRVLQGWGDGVPQQQSCKGRSIRW